jgi:hypothetical protein
MFTFLVGATFLALTILALAIFAGITQQNPFQ